jgi:hypothetical protein
MVPKAEGENEMNPKAGWTRARLVLVVGAVSLAFAVSMRAQVQTETKTSGHQATVKSTIERAKVIMIWDNNMIVQMEDGSILHIANVPESARATVDGKEIGISDVKAGMTLQRTVTTISREKTITTVQSVTGTVWRVMPPTSVILTLENGKNQQFKIPKNQKFNVNGQMVDAWGLKKGMKVSATKIVEVPFTEVTQNRTVTGEMPTPPSPPPPDVPILIVEEAASAPVEVAQAAPAELPKTASPLPLIGLLGFLSLASSLGLRTARKSR